jgi:uncharacterized protein GlcG (DUF336 family)
MNQKNNTTNRRDFLKTGAVAAGGFMILPRHVLGGPGYVAPSDKLVVAGIGVGGKGESDLHSFHQRCGRRSCRWISQTLS